MSLSQNIQRRSYVFQKTKVIEVLEQNDLGQVLRRTLLTPEWAEISFYDPGTQAPTAWIVKNDQVDIEARFPVDGVFRRIEVKKRKEKSEDRLVYVYHVPSAGYRLFEAQNVDDRLYQRAFEDVQITRGECRTQALKRLTAPFEDVARLLAEAQDEALFLERLNTPEVAKNLFASSCLQSQPENTLSDPEDMARTKEALAEIMGSYKKKNASRYLKCMSDQGLSLHAARIEATLIGVVEQGKNIFNSARPLLTCESNMISRELAHFNATNGQINITRKPSQMLPEGLIPDVLDLGGNLAPQLSAVQLRQNQVRSEVGKTLFHELIHSSGIEDENFVEEITQCCGSGFNEGSEACLKMKKEVDRLERIQTAQVLLNSGEWPWYNELNEKLTYGDVTTESKKAFEKAFAQEFDEEFRRQRDWGPECYESSEAQIACNQKFGDKFRETIQSKAISICRSTIRLKQRGASVNDFCSKIAVPETVPAPLPEGQVGKPSVAKAFSRVPVPEPARPDRGGQGQAPSPAAAEETTFSLGSVPSMKIPARFEGQEPRAPVGVVDSSSNGNISGPESERSVRLELPQSLDRGTQWRGATESQFSGQAFRDSQGSFVSPLGRPRADLQRDIDRPRQLIQTVSQVVEQVGLTIPKAQAAVTLNPQNSRSSQSLQSRSSSSAGGRIPASEAGAENGIRTAQPARVSASRSVRPQRSSAEGGSRSVRSVSERSKGKKKKRTKKSKEQNDESSRRVSSSGAGFVPERASQATSAAGGSVQLIQAIESRPAEVQDLLLSANFRASLIRNKILIIDGSGQQIGSREADHIYVYKPETGKFEKQSSTQEEASP